MQCKLLGTTGLRVSELCLGAMTFGFVIATKYTMMTHPNDPNASGNQRKNLMRSLDASSKRLNTDYIDLCWVHMWDTVTPVAEIMRS